MDCMGPLVPRFNPYPFVFVSFFLTGCCLPRVTVGVSSPDRTKSFPHEMIGKKLYEFLGRSPITVLMYVDVISHV
jgi:hypothetical protein